MLYIAECDGCGIQAPMNVVACSRGGVDYVIPPGWSTLTANDEEKHLCYCCTERVTKILPKGPIKPPFAQRRSD